MRRLLPGALVLIGLSAAACLLQSYGTGQTDAPLDGDGDTDTDADTDADSDTDTDADDGGEDGAIPACEEGVATCEGDQLLLCSGGTWELLEQCVLGCSSEGPRCLEIVPSNVDPDLMHRGVADLTVSEAVSFNTDTGQITGPSGAELRPAGVGELAGIHFTVEDVSCRGLGVFSLASLSVVSGGQILGVGERGLVLLVRSAVVIDGAVVVSAVGAQAGVGGYPGGARGAAGQGPSPGGAGTYNGSCCDAGGGGGGHAAEGGGGGPAYGAAGGAGGGTTGGDALVPLCGGSGGGGESSPYYPGGGVGGGAGGGAVQISSGDRIAIGVGSVRASGGGGPGGYESGGGGGGSGGAILLEAPVVEIGGSVLCNGGGGGAGSYQPAGGAGTDGDLGGAGGPANTFGSGGGNGGAGTNWSGAAASSNPGNGGGGGGAAGRIRINSSSGSTVITGTVSPTPPSQGIITTR